MSTVLVVDDKEMMRDSVAVTLRRAGFDVAAAPGVEEAVASVASRRPEVIVTDLKMPDGGGIELIERVRRIDDELPIIVMTAFGSIESAVQAMRQGAFDYITKPFEGDELVIAVKRAAAHARTLRENAVFRAESGVLSPAEPHAGGGRPEGRPVGLERIVGESPAMRAIKEQVRTIAESQGTVLITGESGTGKEVVARAIHDLSARRQEPFLAVNCAALSESLLESELFGHERGAFTGADRLRKGRFELADRGTLVLDEVSEVSPAIQAKLLRVLQERAFERVGSSLTIGVDVRVIATSNRDLPAAAAQGEFRQDLFFRLNVLPVRLPPLRERAEDVPLLAAHFLAEVARREGRQGVRFDEGALALLRAYTWPGNVRELQNICERAVVLRCAPGGGDASRVISRDMIEPWLLPHARPLGGVAHAPIRANGAYIEPKAPAPELNGAAGDALPTLEEIERSAIVQTLRRFNGHRQRTARALGIGVRTLGLKLKKWKQLQLVSQEL